MIALTSNFSLDLQEDGVYFGYKIQKSLDIRLPICIIRFSEYQMQNYEILLSLGDNGPNVLSIFDISDFEIEGKSSIFFVVPSIKSVDYFFMLKEKGFSEQLEPIESVDYYNFLKGKGFRDQQEPSEKEKKKVFLLSGGILLNVNF
ncbi:hypothetical protein OROMI_005075 [Orobanche minor]